MQALGHFGMKQLRESIEDLAGTEQLATPALQSAYTKGFHAARTAAVEILADAEDRVAAQLAENDAFPRALFSAIAATIAGAVAGFAGVHLLEIHIGWVLGFSALGSATGVGIAASVLRRP